jgi:membrane fusion protein (multidrug efflux system)
MTERFGHITENGAKMPHVAVKSTPARRPPDGHPHNPAHDPAPSHTLHALSSREAADDQSVDRAPGSARPIAADPAGAAAKPAKRKGRLFLAGAAVVAVLALGGWYGGQWWLVGRFQVTTDNAYVGAKNATLAAKVSGYVARIAVDDNAAVRAGDVIATIDDGDYRLAVEQAQAKLATQRAAIARLDKQILAQQALEKQAKAQLTSARAGAVRAELELARQQSLASREFASRQALETAQSNRDQSDAGVNSAEAAIAAAAATVDVIRGQREEAARTAVELETAVAKAERDLSFAVIRAPFDGVIGNRAMQVGDYVQPGQRLASLVPLDAVYVDANFKETQLARLRAGQPVTISVDALPGMHIDGTVASVAPASGSVFSLLPPDNATGNFTKIVQRMPVRVAVPADVAASRILRPGMSVFVSVDTAAKAERPIAALPVPVNAN